MNINITYNSSTLTYKEFYEIDKECFPYEPFNLENFNEMRMGYHWAAFIDHNLVGYAYVKMKTNSVHLSRIGVSKQYRRMGIADQLMKTIVAYCNDSDRTIIDLLVQADNFSAINLYENFGFKHMESSYQYIIPICNIISKYKRTAIYNLTAIPIVQKNIPLELEHDSEYHDNKNILPKRYKLNFIDSEGIVHGSCHLDPGFPGCSTFIINEPNRYLLGALASLEKYLNPTEEKLILTFSDKSLMRTCSNLGFKLNYELIIMRRG